MNGEDPVTSGKEGNLVEPSGGRGLRVESQSIHVTIAAGVFGAVVGLIIGIWMPALQMTGDGSLGQLAALAAGVVAVVITVLGSWRSRDSAGHVWRHELSRWRFTINTISLALVHGALAVLGVLVLFLVLSHGFVDLHVNTFWTTVLMVVTMGLVAYLTYPSVVRMTTQHMASLLMIFVVLGTLTAMVETPDPTWWQYHFSYLGTFWHFSSFVFNGTLITGGLLLTTFAVYLTADMKRLVSSAVLSHERSPRAISIFFLILGIMLAGVGFVPVNVSIVAHNSFATGMAVMYLGLLCSGPWLLRGMPRTYFVATLGFLVALVVSCVLFFVGFFNLTALEVIVFALIFGWISVFIRFLGAGGHASARHDSTEERPLEAHH